MKKLIISLKSTQSAFNEVEKRLLKAEQKKGNVSPHFEVSFTEAKDFKRFIGNIDVLTSIQRLKPKSIYQLSQLLKKDVGNLNKLINFFESLGAIELRESIVNGRKLKKPIVPYHKIEFQLAA